MPANTQRGRTQRTTTRGRTAPARKDHRSNGSGRKTQRSNGSAAASGRSSGRATSGAAAARARSGGNTTRNQSSTNGSHGHGTLTDIGISALSATVGVAGGVLLGRTTLQRTRKVLGVSVPSKVDFGDIGKQIGEAGRQFGKLATEVQAVRRKAEQIGRVLG
jgi:hypothetical protein